MKIAVLYGGISREREVSLRGGERVAQALEKLGHHVERVDVKEDFLRTVWNLKGFDAVFPMLHGRFGEDGTIQGILEYLKVPYVGSGVLPSALCFNKLASYEILKEKVTIPKYVVIDSPTRRSPFGFPVFVKPISEGSSIGAHVCHNEDELEKFTELELDNYEKLFLMEYIKGRELTISIVEIEGKPTVLPILELRPKKEFYDYEAKYTKGLTEFILPSPLEESERKIAESAALTAYKTLGCSSFGRVDGILRDGEFYFLEVNSIPGMTETSDLPASAKEYGLSFEDLVSLLLKTASIKEG